MLILALLMFDGFIANAQDFEVPKNFNPKTKDDFAAFEKDVIACVNWLETTPPDQNIEKRKDAGAFLIQWISGSPTVTISLDAQAVVKVTDKNPQLLVLFLGGWTRYALQNNYSKDIYKGYYEGLKSVVGVAKKSAGLKKDKDLDKVVAIYDKGELENWIKENVKTK